MDNLKERREEMWLIHNSINRVQRQTTVTPAAVPVQSSSQGSQTFLIPAANDGQ